MKYADRVVVVTGAREGVGRMVCEHFLAEGATVVGLSRGESDLDGQNYTHIPTNIGKNDQVRAAFTNISKTFGKVDYLINCAAVATSTYALIVPVAGAEEMMATNVLGLLYVSREAAKLMRHGGGRIVNIGSIHARMAPIGASIYAASKSAQATLVQVLSKEFASWSITVNTLALSPIETSMLRKSGTPEVVKAVIDGLTIPRLAEAEDVMAGLDFFVSDQACFYTGQTLYLGGVHE